MAIAVPPVCSKELKNVSKVQRCAERAFSCTTSTSTSWQLLGRQPATGSQRAATHTQCVTGCLPSSLLHARLVRDDRAQESRMRAENANQPTNEPSTTMDDRFKGTPNTCWSAGRLVGVKQLRSASKLAICRSCTSGPHHLAAQLGLLFSAGQPSKRPTRCRRSLQLAPDDNFSTHQHADQHVQIERSVGNGSRRAGPSTQVGRRLAGLDRFRKRADANRGKTGRRCAGTHALGLA